MTRIMLTVAMAMAAGMAQAGESPIAFILAQHRAPGVAVAQRAAGAGHVVRASYYGGGERLSRYTASGEVFRPMALTAAHRSYAFGTRLEVTNLANGRMTVVRISDRGPARSTGRDLDLSKGAAVALGMLGAGEARVTYRVIE